jgi:hypothetical protein
MVEVRGLHAEPAFVTGRFLPFVAMLLGHSVLLTSPSIVRRP